MSDIEKKKFKFNKNLKPLRDRNGVVIGAEFVPNTQMRIWVSERANKANINKNDCQLLKECGWKSNLLHDWEDAFGDYYIEWYIDALHIQGAKIKEILEQVGKEESFKGNFPFWKEMARTHQVISNEKTEHSISLAHLTKDLDNLTDAELEARRNTLLLASRGIQQEQEIKKDE